MLQLGRLAAAVAREVRAALTADQFEMLADDVELDGGPRRDVSVAAQNVADRPDPQRFVR